MIWRARLLNRKEGLEWGKLSITALKLWSNSVWAHALLESLSKSSLERERERLTSFKLLLWAHYVKVMRLSLTQTHTNICGTAAPAPWAPLCTDADAHVVPSWKSPQLVDIPSHCPYVPLCCRETLHILLCDTVDCTDYRATGNLLIFFMGE